ncbi:MAG: serine hydrolase family protein [bacterium]|nr:serine hydrolase family protein [bacterium]
MPNVFIIHGAYGHPLENWFPWLKTKLQNLGCQVFVPKFPTPQNQSLKNWLDVFDNYQQYLTKDSIVVGHSLGPAFLLSVLEKRTQPIKAAFFVAGFAGLLNNEIFDKINKTFVDKQFNWPKIKQNCHNFFLFHSDNDPYVPISQAQKLAKNLGVEVAVIKGAGHFNQQAGYTKFELLFDQIKQQLSVG